MSEYEILDEYNVLLRKDGRHTIVSMKLFNELYLIVNDYDCALKEDCIEYVVHEWNKPIEHYPEWYQFAVKCYEIFKIGDSWHFYTENGEIAMSPRAIILRNIKGELRYLEFPTFYDIYRI